MRILILGCGWVGEPVAMDMKRQGHEVWASTTQYEKYHRLKANGIFSFIVDFDNVNFSESVIPDQFDFVLNSVPASQKNSLQALDVRFSNVAAFLRTITWKKHLFLSSIGVYPDKDGTFDELYWNRTALNEKLLLAETQLLTLSNTIVYGLGGLFGKSRIFAKYFANRICKTGEQPTNFVHLDDVVRLIDLAFFRALKQQVYNVVAPMHPKKKDVIIASAQKYGFALPVSFETGEDFQKVVCGDLLQKELDYHFLWPDPLAF